MTLRAQLTLLSALSVAAAVIVVSLVAYFATRDRLLSAVDDTLHTRAQAAADAPGLPRRGPGDNGAGGPPARDPFTENDTLFQVIDRTGAIVAAPDTQDARIPVTSADIAIANSGHGSTTHDATAQGGLRLRVLTTAGSSGEAVQVARPLSEVDSSLSGLRNILFVVSGAGVAVSAVLGLLVARRALRPVAELTDAAEHVAATQELDASIEVRGRDEIARLARSFNQMLEALLESKRQQHQLVSDASHELRTPLTSLRTNVEVLAGGGALPEHERRELLRDVTFELEELTKLVGELVELASEKRPDAQAFEDIRLDELAAGVVDRAARRSGMRINLTAQPTLVAGDAGLLERSASNLIDNARKWSPPGARIEVSVAAGVFSVRDSGPGIDERDREHVFDRFYRADAARSKPGSGLGLAIVKQIVEAHGGTAWVQAAPSGGTIASFHLPEIAMETEPASPPATVSKKAAPEIERQQPA
ncbi:MAG: HAMP domain-containing histidine kinase [Chloroflexota bacterium]|nr:HAMP domain-containing histidine kinase [Chloroflexota bacterium]